MGSQIGRIFFIDQQIRTRGKVTIKEIVSSQEVSEITAKRDIETMRIRINAPIVYDKKIKGYKYNNEFQLLNFAGEQIFLYFILSRGIAKNEKYLPLTAEYSRNFIIDKLKELLPSEYKSISENFLYITSDYEEMDFDIFKVILVGMKNKQKILINYSSKAKEISDRIIEPLKVVCYGTKWYLAAYCHRRKAVRLFSFSRMNKAQNLDENMEYYSLIPEVDNLINNTFGIAKSPQIKIAEIRFYEPSSHFIKKQIWHSEQKIIEKEINGETVIDMSIPYGMPEELIGRVLKYGATAEIIGPKELRDQWIREIKGLWEKFGKNS